MPVKKKTTSKKKKSAASAKSDLGALAAKAVAGVAAGAGVLGRMVATAFTIPSVEPKKKVKKKPAVKKRGVKKEPEPEVDEELEQLAKQEEQA